VTEGLLYKMKVRGLFTYTLYTAGNPTPVNNTDEASPA